MGVMPTMPTDMRSFVTRVERHKHWNSWFDTPIENMGGLTPKQAALTREGRIKLDAIFAIYDDGRDEFSLQIPTEYAKWRLDLLPSRSVSDFAWEEDIVNNMHDGQVSASTNRSAESKKRLAKKQAGIFVVRRCEVNGCDKKGEAVKNGKCARCRLVFYCGKEHQTEDWPRHKKDCNHLKNSELRRIYFDADTQLEKYPIGCFPLPDPPADAVLSCFVCGAKSEEVKIGFTECCNAPVCDNEEEYRMSSSSEDFCLRTHRRFTLCGHHNAEDSHTDTDWRTCTKCKTDFESRDTPKDVRSWYSTNGFNLTPCLEDDAPKGSNITAACSTCSRRLTPGHDSRNKEAVAQKSALIGMAKRGEGFQGMTGAPQCETCANARGGIRFS